MDPSSITVSVSTYVAAAIVEHAKRRNVAAGYLMGEVTTQDIRITDYFPITHVDNLDNPSSREYIAERMTRQKASRPFSANNAAGTQGVIGWYSAGTPIGVTREEFDAWCQAPSVTFEGKNAVHVHCALPSEAQRLEVSWTAFRSRTTIVDKIPNVVRDIEYPVVISGLGHTATNVFLNHIASLALYKGTTPYASSNLLNLDTVAFENAKRRAANPNPTNNNNATNAQQQKDEPLPKRGMEESLMATYQKLQGAIKYAKGVTSGSLNTTSRPQDKIVGKELLENLEAIHAARRAEMEQQENITGREDSNTQRFKDAIMTKCTAIALRRTLTQIDYLAKQYSDMNATTAAAGAAGAAGGQQQQQRGGNNHYQKRAVRNH